MFAGFHDDLYFVQSQWLAAGADGAIAQSQSGSLPCGLLVHGGLLGGLVCALDLVLAVWAEAGRVCTGGDGLCGM